MKKIRKKVNKRKCKKKKRTAENKRIIEEKKRKEKKLRKEQLEKHWEMMKWAVHFIEENKEEWEQLSQDRREQAEAIEENERWESLRMEEKARELEKLAEDSKNKHLTREDKIELAKEKRRMWTDWREPEPNLKRISTKKLPEDSVKDSLEVMGGGEGDPEMGKDPPCPKKSPEDTKNGPKAGL